MRRILLATVVVLALGAASAAAQGRPLTVDDFLSLDRVGEPAISPDGRWVVYTVTTTDLTSGRRRQDLWLQHADSAPSASRRISTDSLGGRSARWSPDGTRIAYVTSRGGPPQIWVFEVAGGAAARQVTSLSTGTDGPVWSPSGRMILFSSGVHPDCPDDACNKRRAEEDAKRPSRAREYDELLFRHWNTWDSEVTCSLSPATRGGGGATQPATCSRGRPGNHQCPRSADRGTTPGARTSGRSRSRRRSEPGPSRR